MTQDKVGPICPECGGDEITLITGYTSNVLGRNEGGVKTAQLRCRTCKAKSPEIDATEALTAMAMFEWSGE